jgi:hypothetical protein
MLLKCDFCNRLAAWKNGKTVFATALYHAAKKKHPNRKGPRSYPRKAHPRRQKPTKFERAQRKNKKTAEEPPPNPEPK